MADDYENIDEIANLSDEELHRLIRTELASQRAIDVNDISVYVHEGQVRVSGRVGTEEEVRIVDHVLTDVIGLTNLDNQIVVDEIRRAESPEPIDEHLADEDEHAGLLLGDEAGLQDPEAEHLVVDHNLNPTGTHDVSEAIEAAEPWIPPESPTPEGLGGQDQGRFGADADR